FADGATGAPAPAGNGAALVLPQPLPGDARRSPLPGVRGLVKRARGFVSDMLTMRLRYVRPPSPGADLPSARRKRYSGLICTLRNFTTPEPYCRANGPLRCFESSTSAVFCPFSTTTRCGPFAVIS